MFVLYLKKENPGILVWLYSEPAQDLRLYQVELMLSLKLLLKWRTLYKKNSLSETNFKDIPSSLLA
jgi:hypothetical protein